MGGLHQAGYIGRAAVPKGEHGAAAFAAIASAVETTRAAAFRQRAREALMPMKVEGSGFRLQELGLEPKILKT